MRFGDGLRRNGCPEFNSGCIICSWPSGVMHSFFDSINEIGRILTKN